MVDFTKTPEPWQIGDCIEQIAWFVAHGLILEETANDVVNNILVGRITAAVNSRPGYVGTIEPSEAEASIPDPADFDFLGSITLVISD